jgi:hypothetical protein
MVECAINLRTEGAAGNFSMTVAAGERFNAHAALHRFDVIQR